MEDATEQARIAALSLAHGGALARLLRAHGREDPAGNLESALEEVFRIVAAELGERPLREAIRWVAAQTHTALAGPTDASHLRH